MTRVVVALDEPHGAVLATELEREGVEVVGILPAGAPATAARDEAWGADPAPLLAGCEALVLRVDRDTLTPELVALCDRLAVRIVALADRATDERFARSLGVLAPLPFDADAVLIAEAAASARGGSSHTAPPRTASPRRGSAADAPVTEQSAPPPRPAAEQSHALPDLHVVAPVAHPPTPAAPLVIVVWGPAGSPGRSTLAIELAVELARGGRTVGLVDADTHSPSLALALGLADEGPGFAAACRQAERGTLDATELRRISSPVHLTGGAVVEVLTGINRPGRWPELGEARVAAALTACREWVDVTVVDVAAPLESDEEIVSDLDGPRRNAATLAALREADLVVAVASADPLGVSRFVRAVAELRAVIGSTPIAAVANKLRPGALGIDSRGQVRQTLDRFAGIRDVSFLPLDPRSADAAVLAARPIADLAPRSPLVAAVRRFADAVVSQAGAPASVVPSSGRLPRRSRSGSRRVRDERLSA